MSSSATSAKQEAALGPLRPNHLADLRKSGLSDEQIEACGFGSLVVPSHVEKILRWNASRLWPCLVIPYRHADGSLIRLSEFARIKPDHPRVSKPKDGKPGRSIKYESPKGSISRLYFPPHTCAKLSDASTPLVITEGEKKAAKADQEGFACIGLGGVDAWSKKREADADGKKLGKRELITDFDDVTLNGREVFIVFDSDLAEKSNVQWAEWNLSQALTERGAVVKVVRLPNGPPDTNSKPTKIGLDDFLVAHSVDEFRELFKAALPPQKLERQDDRAEIVISTDEVAVNDAAIQALMKDDSLYQRAGRLVHVVTNPNHDGIDRPDDVPRILPLSLPGLRERLTRVVRFVTIHESKDGERETRPAHPPKWCYEAVAARGQWPGIRPLAGVVMSPVLRPDGSVLNQPGYDPATGLLFDPQGISFPVIDQPTRDDALRAVAELFDLVTDFPFRKPEHRAAWLTFLLTPLARFAFTGPAPLFLVDANIRGSGKSLLCDVVSLIVTGRDMPRMANPKDDDEARKRITALAQAGDTLCLIDNIVGGLGCASLDAALTGTTWKDRILGRTEIVELPLLVTWSASGNNTILHADTSRRVVHIRLDSRLENPEQREGFRHPNLRAYIRKHRPKLLASGLTILAAYCLARRPHQKLPPWGSFEGWSDLVRQAVAWCGQPDPGMTRAELVEQSDREAIALRELLAGWDELDPDCHGLTTAEILDRISKHPDHYGQVRDAVLELCPAPAGKSFPSAGSLGSKLGHLRGRMVNNRCLNYREGRGRRRVWQVSTEADSSGDTGDAGDTFLSPSHNEKTENPNLFQYEKGPEKESPASPASPKPCEVCGSGRLWRSYYGSHTICGSCKAPPTPGHVKEWIEVPQGPAMHERHSRR